MSAGGIHRLFQVSVALKGFHAVIECAGGIALFFIKPETITDLVNTWTQDELLDDKNDFIATHLQAWAQTVSLGSARFFAFYLLTHGAVKLLLVAGLLRGKLWSYPASLIVMSLFIAYQLYRFTYTHGAGLIVLTVFDLGVIWLVWHEWRLVRRHPRAR
jgi:uncharacterized membrane protein